MAHEVGDRDEALKQFKLHLLKTQEQMKRIQPMRIGGMLHLTFEIGFI